MQRVCPHTWFWTAVATLRRRISSWSSSPSCWPSCTPSPSSTPPISGPPAPASTSLRPGHQRGRPCGVSTGPWPGSSSLHTPRIRLSQRPRLRLCAWLRGPSPWPGAGSSLRWPNWLIAASVLAQLPSPMTMERAPTGPSPCPTPSIVWGDWNIAHLTPRCRRHSASLLPSRISAVALLQPAPSNFLAHMHLSHTYCVFCGTRAVPKTRTR